MIDFGVSEKKQKELLERMRECSLNENDMQESFVRSSGPGGQKTNKTATCVSLKHVPTGLSVKTQTARTQSLNRYYARKRMCELLEEKLLGDKSPSALKAEKIRKQKKRRKRRGHSNQSELKNSRE
jgi:peptide chain release factor